jgi:hypothetical protein
MKWPTLEGRLNNPIKSRLEGLRQMKANGDILTPEAEKDLLRLEKEEVMKEPRCDRHPKYKGIRKPLCQCSNCWDIWDLRHRGLDKEKICGIVLEVKRKKV